MIRLERSPLGLYIIGIAMLFLAGFMLLVVFGASTYSDIVDGQEHNNHTRSLRSYLTTCVQSVGPDQVAVVDGEEGSMLEIGAKDTDYVLRIYQHDGYLVEDYAERDSRLHPDSAEKIVKTERFQIERASDHAVYVDTDAGRTILHVGKEARQ